MGLDIAFWVLAPAILLGALGVILLKNVFRAALSLIFSFVGVAGLYVMLSADFLAAVQILVYVGAISVIIVLAIMLTRNVECGGESNTLRIPALIVAAVFLGVMVFTVLNTSWGVIAPPPLAPTTQALGEQLFSADGFILPVEIAAVLLLAAVIGAIVIARER